jgi:hypothetical protein
VITRSLKLGRREHESQAEWREAAYSDDEIYRYRLDITFDPENPRTLVTIGLNPSTATENKDDPTIRVCKRMAKDLDCGTYRMLNAFAFRSTDYKALFRNPDPIGPENTLEYLRYWCDGATVVACWGAHITERPWRHFYRGREIAAAIPNLQALKVTQSGHPHHPLYLPVDIRLQPFAYAID